ncbi:MAG TPA: hypothetical protein VED46_18170 [Alphaproteobacteria bacterium]|nr:hypothetical protein [Alphaproteobacteria bacterium]
MSASLGMSAKPTSWADRNWAQRSLIWPLEAAALALVLALLAVLPRRAAVKASGALAAFIGPRLSRQHSRAMRRNLTIAFPDLAQLDRIALTKEIWRHFGRVLSTALHIPSIFRQPDLRGVVDVEGAEHLARAAHGGRFLLVGAHLGHWELSAAYVAAAGHRLSCLYTPESNPWIDRLVRYLRQRGAPNLNLIARGPHAVRTMIESLREGGALFIIVDQRVDDGEWLPYFGRLAQTTTAPARLARRFNCPILLSRAILLPKDRYRVTFYEPLHPDLSRNADTDVTAITRTLNETFETWIREYPAQWLCMKRRWPKHTSRQPEPISVDTVTQSVRTEIPAITD